MAKLVLRLSVAVPAEPTEVITPEKKGVGRMFQRRRGNLGNFRNSQRGAGPIRIGEVLADVLARYGEKPAESVGAAVQPPLVEKGILIPSRQLELFAETPIGASLQTLP
jgi:hypothetical protein